MEAKKIKEDGPANKCLNRSLRGPTNKNYIQKENA